MKHVIATLALIILNCIVCLANDNNDYEPLATKAIEISATTPTEAIEISAADLQPSLECAADVVIPESLESFAIDLSDQNYLKNHKLNIYELPYSLTGRCYDWKRLWINTATLTGAFVGSLAVLECLPEDATNWNRAEIQSVPLFQRWKDHVIKEGPEWDGDKWYFNYVLHPYAGAAYFMGARSCGFNFWQSLLYSAFISTVEWEFGIEAFMERPSIQDLFITPIVGSLIGECFYKLKRHIVSNGYCLAGSKVLGNVVAFLIDPLNQFLGLFYGNPSREAAKLYQHQRKVDLSSSFIVATPSGPGLGIGLTCVF